MMGINRSLYEAADIDGATSWQKFIRITLPLLKPVLLYTLVTSAIGGLQLYDIPALFNTNGSTIGYPDDTSTTVTMYIMRPAQHRHRPRGGGVHPAVPGDGAGHRVVGLFLRADGLRYPCLRFQAEKAAWGFILAVMMVPT